MNDFKRGMVYPPGAEDKLGLTEVKLRIKAHCLSDMGKEMVDRIQVITNFELIGKFLKQTREFKEILENDAPLPIRHFYDLRSLAEKARIEGAFLTEEDFFKVWMSLLTVFSVIGYFNEREGTYTALEALFEHLMVEKSIIKSIEKVIDDKGKIRSNASADLQAITASIARSEQEARKKIDSIYRNAQNSGWTADGSLTIRDGRLCIPLLAENKRKVKGFVHDESASGQTVYLEPEEVFHLNNQIRDLEFDRRREIVKILTSLTTEMRPYVPLLLSYHGLLTKLDFVRAKALFALDTDAELPQIVNGPEINLIKARHH